MVYHKNPYHATWKVWRSAAPGVCRIVCLTLTCVGSVHVTRERNDLMDVIYAACLQICVLAFGYLMYLGARFVMQSMRRERYAYLDDDMYLDTHDFEMPSPRASPLEDSVVFRNSNALHLYVFRVHAVGFLLLAATMALDFSHPWCPTIFAIGMALQIALTDLVSVYTAQETVIRIVKNILMWVSLLYASYHTHWPVEIMERSVSSVAVGMALMLAAGFAWSARVFAVHCEVDMPDVARDAAISSSLVSAMMLYVIYRHMQIDDIQPGNFRSALYFLTIEPLLKLLSLSVLVYSLKAARNCEVLLAFCLILVIRVQILQTYSMTLQEQRAALCIMLVLCALHAWQSLDTLPAASRGETLTVGAAAQLPLRQCQADAAEAETQTQEGVA